jgi:hypothetical protein
VPEDNLSFHLIFNAYWGPLEFELPIQMRAVGHPWRRWIDTSLESPHDIQDWASRSCGYGTNVSSRTSFGGGADCRSGH